MSLHINIDELLSGKAESLRFYNYPFEAIEESLTNAIYHRSYENQNTIEVSIFPDKIEILSFPGPLPPIDKEILKTKKSLLGIIEIEE
jgi:ATP-dependent DNA helicase RecG